MSKQLVKNYTFNSTAKTVTLTDFSTVLLERLQLITDATTNTILYNFADSTVATATVAGNVITLSTVGTAAGSDKLMIIYDTVASDPTYDAGAYKELTGLSSSALNADLLTSTDVSAYKWISIQITAMAAGGTLSFQGSNDNFATNVISIPFNRISVPTSSAATSTTVADMYEGPIKFRYLRIRQTAWSSGTTNAVIELFTQPAAVSAVGGQITLNGTSSINSSTATGAATPANAFLVGMADTTNLTAFKTINTAGKTGAAGANIAAYANYINNGTTSDMMQSANAVSGGTGAGLLGAGNLIFDGTNWQTQRQSGPVGTAAVAGAFTEQAALSAAALNADLVASTDVSAYKWVSVQIAGTWVGTITFQGSNDNVNFLSIPLTPNSGVNTNMVFNTAGNGMWAGPINYRYFRVRMTSFTSGTATGTVELYTQAGATTTMGVLAGQTGTWSVGSNAATGAAVPANAHYLGIKAASGNLTGLSSADNTGDGGGTSSLASIAYNGTATNTWDRVRNNNTGALVTAGATAGQTVTLTTYNARSLALIVNVSAYTSGTITLAINATTSSGYTYPLLSSITGLTATGANIYRIGIGLTPSAGLVANDVLPRTVQVVIGGTFVATYGIDYNLGV